MNRSPQFQPNLVEDRHYPPGVQILLYLSDTLLRAIHHLAATPNHPRETWLQLWALWRNKYIEATEPSVEYWVSHSMEYVAIQMLNKEFLAVQCF